MLKMAVPPSTTAGAMRINTGPNNHRKTQLHLTAVSPAAHRLFSQMLKLAVTPSTTAGDIRMAVAARLGAFASEVRCAGKRKHMCHTVKTYVISMFTHCT